MEVYRNLTNNFELTFPLTDRTVGDFVTAMAGQLDVNTIIIHYHNATVWVTATFSGTPVELGSTGYYHISVLSSWFTALDTAFPINVKLIDDAGTKQWKDQSIIINHKLDAEQVRDILVDTNQMQGKLPTNNIMGSSVKTDKDDEIDNIDGNVTTITGKLPTNKFMGSSVPADKDITMDNIDTGVNNIEAELPVVGPIASQGDVQALSNNTRARISVPTFVQIPPTGDTMIPIQLYYFDDAGDPVDPDNNEVSIQARAVNGAAYKLAFFDDEAGTVGATASTTFTPNYFKLDKITTGQYQTFYKLPSTENTDIWQLIFKLEDTAVELAFPASMGILEEVPVLTLDDSTENRQIIAKSMKIEDVSGESPVADSVYQDIITDTNAIVAKLPTGTISDLALTSVIDGQPLSYILELIMALVNGRYLKDSPVAGQLTIFKRDNATILTIIQITDTEGTRIS